MPIILEEQTITPSRKASQRSVYRKTPNRKIEEELLPGNGDISKNVKEGDVSSNLLGGDISKNFLGGDISRNTNGGDLSKISKSKSDFNNNISEDISATS